MALVVAFSNACETRPSDEELDRLRAEANAANEAAAKQFKEDKVTGFSLTVTGQVATPATLSWSELETLGKTHVVTASAQDSAASKETDFEGILVRDLLDRHGAAPDATEATVVSIDGFRATVQTAHAREYRMLLAIKANGAAIPRSSGGPIFLIHPFTESPKTRELYPDRFWAFYVTHLVVGTEAPKLTIQGKTFDRAAIEAMPQASFDGPHGFKVEWTSDSIHLRGVSLVDAIAAAGVPLPPHGTVVIRGKSPIHSDPASPIAFAVDDLARCKPLLALQMGLDEKPITARFGGPIVLAFTPCGDQYGSRHWVTFVEGIEIKAAP